MKRGDFIRYIRANGCELRREGARHSLYYNPNSNTVSAVPRHPEIKDTLVKEICKDLHIPYCGKN